MTDLEAIDDALLDWAGGRDPDAICLLQMDTSEIVTLHYMLAMCQWLCEESDENTTDMDDLASLRKNVEAILVSTGYGGDPRP